MTLKTLSYLKCQIQFLFAFVLRIFWHKFDISKFSTIVCFLNFGDLDLWPICMIFLDNACIIPGYLHMTFCNNRPTFNEVLMWYRAVDSQTHSHTHTNTSIFPKLITKLTQRDIFCQINKFLHCGPHASPDGWAVWGVVLSTRWWL